MKALDLLFERAAAPLTGAFLLVALGVMAAQVLFRYLFNDSLVWAEELARYALVWSSMLGSAVMYRRGGHIAVVEVVRLLPDTARAAVARAVHLGVFAFAALLAWQGSMLVARNLARHQLSTALQVQIAWVQLAIPVGAALIAIAAIEALWRGNQGRAGDARA